MRKTMNVQQFSNQTRMARAALQWTVRELATKAGVSVDTVLRAEKADETIRRPTWTALQSAFENARIEFFENGSVVLHPSTDGMGVAASPDMPLGVRRIYPR
jgi:transcriptional regulator with XRE-family HTH domain